MDEKQNSLKPRVSGTLGALDVFVSRQSMLVVCAMCEKHPVDWEWPVLLYKRLASNSFQWPRKESEARTLTPQQYRWLKEGLSADQPKMHKPVSGLEIV